MNRVAAICASFAILALAICLTVDLLVSSWDQRPTPTRHVVLAVGLTALITIRICERLLDGSL